MDRRVLIGGAAVGLGAVLWFALTRGTEGGNEIEYRYAAVERGEILLSTSSTGVLVPLTVVDLKSRAGGEVQRLFVEEGSEVRRGDLIALIDPRDTRNSLLQAQSDLSSATARVSQAQTNAELEARQSENSVRDAELRVRQAEIALSRAREENRAQPELTEASVRNAEASLAAAQEGLSRLTSVEFPQRRREAETSLERTTVDEATARAEFDRQTALLERGFVARSSVEQAQRAYESARTSRAVAAQRMETLEAGFATERREQEARVRQAEAALRSARANTNQVVIAEQNLRDAQRALEQSRVSLRAAEDNRLQVRSRRLDVDTARASAVRSRVAVENSQLQLGFTRVEAPRDGVVTVKYLEEGTIVPPGTSLFAQGTSIVQLADVSQMFVECLVDEADIASVREGQDVRIVVEAYPGERFRGVVRKVFPAATSNNNLVTVRVRVEIMDVNKLDRKRTPLRPAMNATCEFVQFVVPEALILPQPALKEEGGETFVLVKGSDPQRPERRAVKVGRRGNEGIEVLEGLKEGEEVVVAEIDLAAMRERMERMQQTEQGGGFGSQQRGGPSQSRRSGGGGGR